MLAKDKQSRSYLPFSPELHGRPPHTDYLPSSGIIPALRFDPAGSRKFILVDQRTKDSQPHGRESGIFGWLHMVIWLNVQQCFFCKKGLSHTPSFVPGCTLFVQITSKNCGFIKTMTFVLYFIHHLTIVLKTYLHTIHVRSFESSTSVAMMVSGGVNLILSFLKILDSFCPFYGRRKSFFGC